MSHHETWDTKPDAPGGISRRVSAHRHRRARHPHRRTFAAAGPAYRQAGDHSLDAPSLVGARQGDVLEHHRASAASTRKSPPICRRRARIGPASARWCRGFARPRPGFPAPCSCRIRWSTTTRCKRATTPAFSARSRDPVIIRPDRGRAWGGISRDLGAMVLQPRRRRRFAAPDRPAKSDPARSISASARRPAGRTITFGRWRSTSCSARRCRPRSISTASRSMLRDAVRRSPVRPKRAAGPAPDRGRRADRHGRLCRRRSQRLRGRSLGHARQQLQPPETRSAAAVRPRPSAPC